MTFDFYGIMLSMAEVLYQVLCELTDGKVVRGSIELPNRLVLLRLTFEGGGLHLGLDEVVGLDEPIPFDSADEPDTGLGLPE